MDDFVTEMKKSDAVDFHALVLMTGSWPLQAPSTGMTVPIELAPTYERFTLYYQNKHSGRKLTWLWQLSRMELQTTYSKMKYTFMVSSYQGAILLQFNVGGDSLTYSELSKGTGLDDATLKPTLALLVKQKVLTQEDDDTYDLNLGESLMQLAVGKRKEREDDDG
jgi:cullin 1